MEVLNVKLQKLKLRRRGLKSSLTSHKTFIEKYNEELESNCFVIDQRLCKLEETYSLYCENYNTLIEVAIEMTILNEELATECDEIEKDNIEFYESFLNTKFLFIKQLSMLKNLPESENNGVTRNNEIDDHCEVSSHKIPSSHKRPEIIETKNSSTQNNITSNTKDEHHGCVSRYNLPKIPLPKFDGNKGNWTKFRDAFSRLIVFNNGISEIEKFFHLEGSLDDKTKNIISNIEFSERGFHLAWETLLSRFDVQQDIVENHVKGFFNLKQIKNESAVDLQSFLDESQIHIRALDNLGENLSDVIIVHSLKKKLDFETLKLWEYENESNEEPSWNKFREFLKKRIRVLETMANQSHSRQSFKNNKPSFIKSNTFLTSSSQDIVCKWCRQKHYINNCPDFLKLSPSLRYNKIKEIGVCLNCFKANHKVQACRATPCKICQKKHNVLLHFPSKANQNKVYAQPVESQTCNENLQNNVSNTVTEDKSFKSQSSSFQTLNSICNFQCILSTAIISICDKNGKYIKVRALLDNASMSNFITERLATKLNLTLHKSANSTVGGLNSMETDIKCKVNTTVKSNCSDYKRKLDYLVVDNVANRLPVRYFDISNWSIPKNYQLADPDFNKPGPVDVLLGVEVFYKVLKNGTLCLGENLPDFCNTEFGWIIGGKLEETHNFFLSNSDFDSRLNHQLQRFWEIESLDCKSKHSIEEKSCEELFEKTTFRDSNGRFVVELPFKNNIQDLGESKTMAVKRFGYLENRLMKNMDLKNRYIQFMREYQELGHMKLCQSSSESQIGYFLPHHAVLKLDSSTTKLRVVFDASAKTVSNISLNDTLMVGPVVQQELFSIVLRFRTYIYAFTADIEKMYRQISVCNKHRPYQKIVWREDVTQPLNEFQLTTVTYGTASAPYLATKTLQHLAKSEKNRFPEASKATLENFYVDDILAGGNSVEETIELQNQLINMLKTAGMNLRKWSANDTRLLEQIPEENLEKLNNTNECIKTLGVRWNTATDVFNFEIRIEQNNSCLTKRTVLSCIAKLFDPLGLVAPVVVKAKLFMQQLWLQKTTWDEILPIELQNDWRKFYNELPKLNQFRLNRCVVPENVVSLQLHGFADASQAAFGACIYLRCVKNNGNVVTNILCSKSRVAPLQTTTIPRLELNAALLLSRLMNKVCESLTMKVNSITLWSDSKIVLAWLKSPPYKFKTYVAHRVAEIQSKTVDIMWRHVPSKSNPADILSRGALPDELMHHEMWFRGPSFINEHEESWPVHEYNSDKGIPDVEMKTVSFASFDHHEDIFIIENYSSYTKLIRVVAYCKRFIRNCRNSLNKIRGPLLPDELDGAMKIIVKLIQQEMFSKDIQNLKENKSLSRKSKVLSLSPFIDKDGLFRVGGRIEKSSLNFDNKHQLLLSKHHFTNLLISNVHCKNLHCGLQQTLSIIRQNFWIINGKNTVKGIINKCIVCFKIKPKPLSQLLGDLPKCRIETERPFYYTGLDFCGPFSVRYQNQRKETYSKVYICIFVCLTTKAVHLEVVEDATADAFIACLKRFFNRRGRSVEIWSDNGTNFVGAYNKLLEMESVVKQSNVFIANFCSSNGVNWKFIPPRTPHFGGIWESGVKVIKTHIKKIVGARIMTLEFLYTFVCEIEGIMNSRPLTPMSSDPNDYEPLTPGHFLVGSAINSVLEPDVTRLPINRLKQWKQLTQMVQFYWKRFNIEYVRALQQRQKNKLPEKNLAVNDLVLLVDENLPSTHWHLGRVIEVKPGSDGKVRCAIVRTQHGTYTRGIKKLAKLPVDDLSKTDMQ